MTDHDAGRTRRTAHRVHAAACGLLGDSADETTPPPIDMGPCSDSWPLERWLLLYGGELVGAVPEEMLELTAVSTISAEG